MSILKRFNEMLILNPYKKVLKSAGINFNFKEIEEYSNYVADYVSINTEKKVVPMYIKNDIYILPAVLGILKAGKTPLPLVTSLNLEKSVERISDVNFDTIIAYHTDFSNIQENFKIFTMLDKEKGCSLDCKYDYINNQLDEVYIICTSGTTGVPKKVLLTEENLIWLLETFYSLVEFSLNSNFLFSTPYTFDVSLTEIFAPIFTGGTLYCFDNRLSGVEHLKSVPNTIKEKKITHMSVSPSYAELLLDTEGLDGFKGLNFLCLAGESFSITLGRNLTPLINQGCRVFNLYGPSETTIYATWYELTGSEIDVVPIGVPLNGATCMLLNDNKKSEKKGELYIGGKGVSKGYLLNPNVNKEKFSILDGDRYYATGDYVYYDKNGNLVFDCRKDDQVQVNGIRVELSEIVSIVSNVENVEGCRVSYRDKRLYIFYKSQIDLKSIILDSLPKYFNPVIIKVTEFILNSSRKLDIQAMINIFYLNKENIISDKSKLIEERIIPILESYGVMDIADLDSLDTVRFFLDIEKEFKISIEDSSIVELRELTKLANFLINPTSLNHVDDGIAIEPLSNFENNILNLKIMLNRNYSEIDFEKGRIKTLIYQKNYDLKRYNSLLAFEFNFSNFSFSEILKLKLIVIKLAEKIDILRMILTKDDSLYFRKIKCDRFSPVILVSEDFISDNIICDVLYENYEQLLFLILISKKNRKVRFCFSHHIMDKSSLNILENIVYNSFYNEDHIDYINESSYEDFIIYIKNASKNMSDKEVLELIPTAENSLNLVKLHNKVSVANFVLSDKNSEKITISFIYWICQCIFEEFDIRKITGFFIANIRTFKGFDATNIIGDVHSSIDFEIEKGEDINLFVNKVSKRISLYENGINIYDNVFNGYPNFLGLSGEALQKAETRNISFNYLGEIKNVEDAINNIKNAFYSEKYVIAFTNDGNVYIVTSGNLFKKDKYLFVNEGSKLEINVSTY